MTRLSFRARLFLALFAVSALPVALISVAGVVYIQTQQLTKGRTQAEIAFFKFGGAIHSTR